jgi:hypothetical protein
VKNVQAFLTQHYGFTPDASRVLTGVCACVSTCLRACLGIPTTSALSICLRRLFDPCIIHPLTFPDPPTTGSSSTLIVGRMPPPTDEAGAGTTPPTKQNILEALRWYVCHVRVPRF